MLAELIEGRLLPGILMVAIVGGCGCDDATEPQPPDPPTHLEFTVQPALIERGVPLAPAIRVAIQPTGSLSPAQASAAVTVTLTVPPGGGELAGTMTVAAEQGVATFDDLVINGTGTGYTLTATSAALEPAISQAFDVVLPFVEVAPGAFHTCARTSIGRAYCWGDGGFLGDGSLEDRAVPGPVGGNHSFAAISTGYSSCGLDTIGAVYCWEEGPPVLVSADHGFTALETGNVHSCALTAMGEAYCWGQNLYGSLGDGTFVDQPAPVAVATSVRFEVLSVGAWHTCGLTAGGEAYCWGHNQHGALGDGTRITRTTPVPVAGAIAFAQISAGRYHTCGVTPSGAAHCWGTNAGGELGDGSTEDSDVPIPVGGGISFTSVSAGGEQSCGLTSSGEAYCWGINPFGNLGDGTQVDRPTPTPVKTAVVFIALPVGINQHNCGLRPTGAAFCWGLGSYGQLGGTLLESSDVPTPVLFP